MKRLLAVVLSLLLLAACGVSEGGAPKTGEPEPSSQSQQELESPAPESSEAPAEGSAPAYVTDILYFPEEWTARLAQLQEDEGLWEREDDIRELASLLLEKAEYLCRLAYQDVDGVPVTGRNWENPVTVDIDDRGTFSYYKVRILPYHNVAELWADLYSVYQKEAADDAFGTQYKNLYIDIEGELYAQGGVDAMSKHRIWTMDAARVVEASPEMLALEAEARIMDDSFPARLEIVREEGRWVLTESYFANPKE